MLSCTRRRILSAWALSPSSLKVWRRMFNCVVTRLFKWPGEPGADVGEATAETEGECLLNRPPGDSMGEAKRAALEGLPAVVDMGAKPRR